MKKKVQAFEIQGNTLQEILNYLAEKPFREVAHIILEIQQAKPISLKEDPQKGD